MAKAGFDFSAMLGPLSSGLQLVGGIFDAVSMFGGAKQYKEMAGQYRMMAQQAWEQGAELGRDIRHEGAEVTGAMTAAFGKAGTLLEGSPLLALADTEAEIEENIRRAIEQGRIQQQAFLWQARQAEKAAKGMKMGGIAGLAGAFGGSGAKSLVEWLT